MPTRTDEASRYSVVGNGPENSFVDGAGLVFVNKLGIRDQESLQREEQRGYARAYVRMIAKHGRSSTGLDVGIVREAHGEIFSSLYEWAGRWRTVTISKEGMTWPPPLFLGEAMNTVERETLKRFPPSSLASDRDFCHAVAVIQGEFLAAHPFREGNARTIKLCTNLLAYQTGRPPLTYDASVQGRADYILANKAVVYGVDYAPLEGIIDDALRRSQNQEISTNSGLSSQMAGAREVVAEISRDERALSAAIEKRLKEQRERDLSQEQ